MCQIIFTLFNTLLRKKGHVHNYVSKYQVINLIIALIAGFIIGFVLALPPGPIGVASIKFGVDGKVRKGMQMAVGTAGMDMVYCMLAIFAASAIEKSVGSFFDENPIFLLAFQFAVIIGFAIYGFYNLKKREKFVNKSGNDNNSQGESEFIKSLKAKGPFLLGIALALTNLANPTFLPSLIITSTWVHKLSIFDNIALNNSLFAIGFGLGNFLWLYVLTSAMSKYRDRMSNNFLERIRQFAGITFIGFSGLLGYRVVTFTKWAEILRVAFAF